MSKSCQKVIKKLSKNCQKVFTKIGCPKIKIGNLLRTRKVRRKVREKRKDWL
jgi:hypothetical protein